MRESLIGIADHQQRRARASGRGTSISMSRGATCGSAHEIGRRVAGPGDDARGAELARRLELASCRAPSARAAGRITESVCCAQPSRVAKRGSFGHSGCPTAFASRSNWCSRKTATTKCPSRARKPAQTPSDPDGGPALGRAHRPQQRRHVGERDHRVVHRDVDLLAEPAALALAQRGEDSDHANSALPMSPSAPATTTGGG